MGFCSRKYGIEQIESSEMKISAFRDGRFVGGPVLQKLVWGKLGFWTFWNHGIEWGFLSLEQPLVIFCEWGMVHSWILFYRRGQLTPSIPFVGFLAIGVIRWSLDKSRSTAREVDA